jgi:hypothetical protein
MDAETTLSELVLAAIPRRGAFYATIVREVGASSVEQLDAAIRGLFRSGLIQCIFQGDGDRGRWYRTEEVKKLTNEREVIRSKYTKVSRPAKTKAVTKPRKPRYASDGTRWCSGGQHWLPVNQFGAGGHVDGLHSWCKSCKRRTMKVAREP